MASSTLFSDLKILSSYFLISPATTRSDCMGFMLILPSPCMPSFTSDKHTQALDNLYITLETAIASMPPGDTDVHGARYYTNAFLMHAVALFPELKMSQKSEQQGRRSYGSLDYAVESKADPLRMHAVITYPQLDYGTGIAQNIVPLDTISSNRKRKFDNSDDTDDTAPVVSFGIATDSREWYFQQCTFDKPQRIGHNFPIVHSSKIPTTLNLAADRDRYEKDIWTCYLALYSLSPKTTVCPKNKIFSHMMWPLRCSSGSFLLQKLCLAPFSFFLTFTPWPQSVPSTQQYRYQVRCPKDRILKDPMPKIPVKSRKHLHYTLLLRP